jgi:hypothetical protein
LTGGMGGHLLAIGSRVISKAAAFAERNSPAAVVRKRAFQSRANR